MSYTVIIPSRNTENLRACLLRIDRGSTIVAWDGAEFPAGMQGCVVILGPQPFNFAMNCNLGIKACAPNDVILLNDDALLEVGDFDMLAKAAEQYREFGILVPQIQGDTCSIEQKYQPGRWSLRPLEPRNHMLPFMCAYIPRRVIEQVGLLDEDQLLDEQGRPIYTGEDDMYCARVRQAGLKLGILTSVVVNHGLLPSTFRRNPDGTRREIPCGPARDLYVKKFGRFPA